MDETRGTPPEQKETETTKAKVTAIVVKTLAAIGLIALLALGTWGTVQIVRNSSGIFADIGAAVTNFTGRFTPTPNPMLALELESYSVEHERTFTLNWNIEGAAGARTYVFVYECADGLSFLTPNEEGGNTRIPCGESFSFSSDEAALTLTPISPEARFIDATIKISLINDEERIAAEDEALITVVNGRFAGAGNGTATSTATTTTPRPEDTSGSGPIPTPPPTYYYPVYTTVTVPAVSDPNGYVDLEVEILQVGILDRRTSDRFESSRNELDRDELAGVRFVVRNLGTKTSDEWTFEAELPTSPSHTYRPRNEQRELGPGDRMEITLAFDRLSSRDEDEITIEIDPRDRIDESNERNNEDSVDVDIED